MNVEAFWQAVLTQNAPALRPFFADNAHINWHCTNEHFTVEEFIQANCEYPGQWDGEIERTEVLDGLIVTAVHVFSKTAPLSFHVTSFIRVQEGKILSMDEYWGDDGPPPQWRLDKHIGSPIHP